MATMTNLHSSPITPTLPTIALLPEGGRILRPLTGALWRRTVRYVTSDTGLGDLVEVQL